MVLGQRGHAVRELDRRDAERPDVGLEVVRGLADAARAETAWVGGGGVNVSSRARCGADKEVLADGHLGRHPKASGGAVENKRRVSSDTERRGEGSGRMREGGRDVPERRADKRVTARLVVGQLGGDAKVG